MSRSGRTKLNSGWGVDGLRVRQLRITSSLEMSWQQLISREVLLYHRGNADFRNPEEWNHLCLLNGTQRKLVAKTLREGIHRDYSNRRGSRSTRVSKGIGQPWCR